MQPELVGASDWQRLTTEVPVRAAVRFPVALAIRLQTELGVVDATTIDVSANGLLFRGQELPRVGSKVEFTISMPGPIMGNVQDVPIHCVGRIVRHLRRPTEDQAAAVIDEYFLKA